MTFIPVKYMYHPVASWKVMNIFIHNFLGSAGRVTSELVGLGEVHDGSGGGRRDDDVVGDGLEARDEPLGEERAHRHAEEDDEDVDGGLAEGEAVYLEDRLGDVLEFLRGHFRPPSLVELLRLGENTEETE